MELSFDGYSNHVESESTQKQRIISFNIGGTIFATFYSTICKKIPKPYSNNFYQSNLLEKIVLGQVSATYDDQNIFMDRNPQYFNQILDYLRMSNTNEDFILPKNKTILKELLREARFYQVDGLKEMIKEHYNFLVRTQRAMRQKSYMDSKCNSNKLKTCLQDTSFSSHLPTNYLTSTGKNSDITSCSTFIRSKEVVSNDRKSNQKHALDNSLLVAELKRLKNESNSSKWIYGRISSDCDGSLLYQDMLNNDDTLIIGESKEVYTCFENCTIIFILSSQSFYIQLQNFEKELTRIQPRIDNCLDPLEPSDVLCIGQYREDGLFYRCRILNWNQEANQAECLFIDFGNTEIISISTITKMSGALKQIKPLAINCKLQKELKTGTQAFEKLIELVIKETLFDIKLKKIDLDCFYCSENYDFDPIEVELCTSLNKITINEENLSNNDLWN